MLLLKAFHDGSQTMSSYYLLPVGALGMVISLILCFIPRRFQENHGDGEMQVPGKTNTRQLALLCIGHAVCLTGGFFILVEILGFNFFVSIPCKIWFVLLALWPLWLVVFLIRGWKTHVTMITMLIGLVILSPLFLVFLFISAMRAGAVH